MKKKTHLKFWLIGLMLTLAILACNSPATPTPTIDAQPPTDTAAPAPTDLPVTQATPTSPPPTDEPAEIPPTETQLPEDTVAPPSPTPTTGLQCTIVQNLNLRSGPGIAYRDPIGTVPENAVIFPTAYNPVGIPGGDWVQIEHNNQQGWVAAGSQFITCNFDLATLPSLDVDPPPPPPPPGSVLSSTPDGNCDADGLDCKVIFSKSSFIEIKLYDQEDNIITEKDNVLQVSFSVRKDGQNGSEVYSTVETNAAYCIFGGNDPCNDWPTENYRVVWASGVPVEAGTYFVEILASIDDEQSTQLRWAAEVTIELP